MALKTILSRHYRSTKTRPWFTPTGVPLQKCNWLSVHQLITYHTIMSMHKTVLSGEPQYIMDKITSEINHDSRQKVKFSEKFIGKSERTQSSFCYRGALLYNRLPSDVRSCINLETFKRKLKAWIMSHVPID